MGKNVALATILASLGGGVDYYLKSVEEKNKMLEDQKKRQDDFNDKLNYAKAIDAYRRPLDQQERISNLLIDKGYDPTTGEANPILSKIFEEERQKAIQKKIEDSNISSGADAYGNLRPSYLDNIFKKKKALTEGYEAGGGGKKSGLTEEDLKALGF